MGKYHSNPIFDTLIYEVQFPDGHSEEFMANVIAKCLYSQVDHEGHQYLLLKEIIDWRTTKEALDEDNAYQISCNNNIHQRQMEKGWELCVLCYKLRMFCVPIDGPANVFCDNKSVITNAIVPESTLKKKHNSIAYQKVWEAVTAGILQVAKVKSEQNLADVLTKPLSGPALKSLIQNILH